MLKPTLGRCIHTQKKQKIFGLKTGSDLIIFLSKLKYINSHVLKEVDIFIDFWLD